MVKKFLASALFCFICTIHLFAQYDPSHFYMMGRRALMEGKYSTAIESFNVLSRIDTSDCEAYFFRGISKYNLGDYVGAEKDFDMTLKKNPLYTQGYHYRAITKSQEGKFDEALEDLAHAVDLRPGYIELYFSRGVTFFMSQQFENAIKDFNKYIKNRPKEGAAYLNRGASHLFLGDTTLALADFNKAIQLDMYDADAYVRRSRIYAMKEEYDTAINDLDIALRLDTTNTYAYFNRALLKYDKKDINGALADLEKVLQDEPGNALTLYNRAIIYASVSDYEKALDDFDRVLNINPENVLAYFNRGSVFLEMGRYSSAINDYSKAIDLYPDFAKAYMNRAYAKNMIGQYRSAQQDYDTAQKKIGEYQAKTSTSEGYEAFADTTQQYNHLIALEADFAKKNFDNELLQYREVDINLKPLYRFKLSDNNKSAESVATIGRRLLYQPLSDFYQAVPVSLTFSADTKSGAVDLQKIHSDLLKLLTSERSANNLFAKGVAESASNQFNTALNYYDEAINKNGNNPFYHINKGVLQADMIDFISSMDNNVRVLTLDNSTTTKTRVQDGSRRNYDYSAAIEEMKTAAELAPDFPYTYYNLGNLSCLNDNLPDAIAQYTKALELYSNIPEAYYNRGLIQIYLQDKEKGCLDISMAGELGISDAYSVIKKYCTETIE
ncbi:MAG: tetratricopeptide repeat protein [Bacteroidales bacterium]|nr:tetratricopeptide repeat protein [Bacteroidales bacterium]